jgi:hypothetical protein
VELPYGPEILILSIHPKSSRRGVQNAFVHPYVQQHYSQKLKGGAAHTSLMKEELQSIVLSGISE